MNNFEKAILSVSQLNFYIKNILDADMRLNHIIVRGEISNFTNHYKTGHLYFSLKDNSSIIKAVMFKTSAARLRFSPENGMSVIVFGRVGVYERDGVYQIYAEELQPDGAGALAIAFEQLKEKLLKEGIFDERKKKPIPLYPSAVGVITSPTGAAVKDIFSIIGRRNPSVKIIFSPVTVQGDGAPEQLTASLKKMNALRCCDVIIIGRGGGSAEDLWAFNDENLAREIAASKIPVISAVGHETDFTICDFAADLRAPTPSAAAELCVQDSGELLQTLSRLRHTLERGMSFRLSEEKSRLKLISSSKYLKSPGFFIDSQKQTIDFLSKAMLEYFITLLKSDYNRVKLASSKLEVLNPLGVLLRGYSFTMLEGRTVSSIKDLKIGETTETRLADGSFVSEIKSISTLVG